MKQLQKKQEDVVDTLISDYSKLQERINSINVKYNIPEGFSILDLLEDFEGKTHLSNYIKSVTEISNSSKENNEEINMNHILFKIIKQHYCSLHNLLSYKFNNVIPDNKNKLEWSYEKSNTYQGKLENRNDSLAWFINLKTPSTYWNNENVKKHYSYLITNLRAKDKISIRRIHIFYDDYFKHSDSTETNILRKTNCIHLFWILFFEKLIGIDNRVLIVKNYEVIKDKIYSGKINDNASFFFLDYALYQNPNDDNPFDINEYHILAGDFSLTGPIYSKKDSKNDDEKYESNRIFDLTGPDLFNIFKYNYISFWENEHYIDYLKNSMPENLSHMGDSLVKEKNSIISFLSQNIETSNLFSFWKKINMSHYQLDKIMFKIENQFFDDSGADSIYKKIIQEREILDGTKDIIENEILDKAKRFYDKYLKITKIEELNLADCEVKFNELFKSLIIRDINHEI